MGPDQAAVSWASTWPSHALEGEADDFAPNAKRPLFPLKGTADVETTKRSGSDLLSRAVSRGVPSALEGLTSVFGMGTGGTPPM